MVRLNAQLINMSAQKHNPVRDWELDLRGYRIPVIENLGATLDQFDTIDFTDNDIRKLDQFPLLKRLKHILLSNNRIVRIAENLEENLPSLETLVLINNSLKELSDLDPLSTISTLKYLSLLGNPIVTKRNYRLYAIHKIPSLRVLDFKRIRLREREAASKLFKKKKSQPAAVENGSKGKTFTPGDRLPQPKPVPSAPAGPSKADIASIRRAISNAKTLEEIERLNQMLKTGQVPSEETVVHRSNIGKGIIRTRMEEEVEEEEEEDEASRQSLPQDDSNLENDSSQALGHRPKDDDDDDDEDGADDDGEEETEEEDEEMDDD